ncbi:hypothetical protein PZA11_002668 [Diplocarpon coronariae]
MPESLVASGRLAWVRNVTLAARGGQGREGRRGEGRKWRLGSGGYWDGIKSRNSAPYRILPGGEGRERGERDPSSGLGSRREHTLPAWVPDERISDWQGQHPRANVQPRRERKAVVVFARRGSAQPRHHGDSRQASRFGLGGEGRRAGWIRYPLEDTGAMASLVFFFRFDFVDFGNLCFTDFGIFWTLFHGGLSTPFGRG